MTILYPLLLVLFACGGGKDEPSREQTAAPAVRLHTVMEMNREPLALNSHAGEELFSVLQPMYGYYQTLPHESLTIGAPEDQSKAIYPRIKRMADGRYILFYHGGQLGSRIWCIVSEDFKIWGAPQLLYQPYKVDGDYRRFVNPDAVVLPGGDLLMVCSYRATNGYNSGRDCGLSFRRSSDSGKTWSEPWNVEVGPNWEPYLLVLPDGRIQCYFTDATPWTRNSGTSVIVSEDGGASWSAKKRVCRYYKYDYYTSDTEKKAYNGEKIYTDQMPCFRVLNDGRTLVGWLEDRLEEPAPADCSLDKYDSFYEMSLVYHDGLDWEDLGEDKAGPEKRLNRVASAAAGYISTFRSGETVLSCNKDGQMHLKMCDATATQFYGGASGWEKESGWFIPLEGKGYWSSTEVVAPTILAAAMHCDEGMQTGLLYLNHRQDAVHQAVSVDGDLNEWESDRCFFLGSTGGDELLMRTATQDGMLYLAADCLMASGKEPSITLTLSKEGSRDKTTVVFDKKGLDKSSASGTSCVSTVAESLGGAKGFVSEIAIPLSSLGAGEGDTLRLYVLMKTGSTRTVFSFSNGSDSATWQKIKL